ncbi:hypothetical protein CYMTET_9631 [Cymbomonas tetramitiformis]|uniref:Cytochrome b5 heme-binding domain-containing protein n=1 Tax=Cymbomonas tetramitiformis TaxID=36881 RepID=A0AAE0LFA0_9CHLO|nr:hypothetical protein CYMTET_9631 [Cymbomonas tetramitiformis]|eukprot:gene5382-6530_t
MELNTASGALGQCVRSSLSASTRYASKLCIKEPRALRSKRFFVAAGPVPQTVRTTTVAPPAPVSTQRKAAPKTRQEIKLLIDGQWYDCAGWAKAHPGGGIFIRLLHGRDATDVFYALHSYGPNGADTAAVRLAKLPKCEAPEAAEGSAENTFRLPLADSATAEIPGSATPERDEHAKELSMNFQEFRTKLENEGWFDRSVGQEIWALAQVLGLCAVGSELAWNGHPWLATLSIGLGMEQAGWLGHDYIHGRGKWCEFMRLMPALINGHGAGWWSEKHNLHHCFTNHEGLDRDVAMEPVFWLRSPDESGRADHPLRKFQHLYSVPMLAIVFWLWRYQSARFFIRGQCADGNPIKVDWVEVGAMVANYAWLATLPLPVALGSVTLSGWLVGNLVTATHQCEEIMPTDQAIGGFGPGGKGSAASGKTWAFDEFVDTQFRSTRDAECVFGPAETWLWGGMDTQLEHHLFPTMPRYKYHKLRPVLKKWADAHNAGYRISPSTTILKDNWTTLRDVASV